jgi:spore coat-associated protein N
MRVPSRWQSRTARAFLTLAVLALLAVTLQTLVFSGADFTSLSSNPSQSFTAGTVSHINDRENQAILTATNLRPGASSAPGLVTITGGEDVPAAYSVVKGTVTPATGLAQVLYLRIEDAAGGPALFDNALSAFGTVGLAMIAPGDSKTYRFTLYWPVGTADPALQGASITVPLEFVGVSL